MGLLVSLRAVHDEVPVGHDDQATIGRARFAFSCRIAFYAPGWVTALGMLARNDDQRHQNLIEEIAGSRATLRPSTAEPMTVRGVGQAEVFPRIAQSIPRTFSRGSTSLVAGDPR